MVIIICSHMRDPVNFLSDTFLRRMSGRRCSITFSNLLHNYNPTEISRETAMEMTGGNLPEGMLEEYLRMFAGNLSGV